MSGANPPLLPPSLLWARRLGWAALVGPLLVVAAIVAHLLYFELAEPLRPLRQLADQFDLVQLTLAPSGTPTREGPGSHPAVDVRHGPQVPAVGSRRARQHGRQP
jgi:HAMP domain-containing protein